MNVKFAVKVAIVAAAAAVGSLAQAGNLSPGLYPTDVAGGSDLVLFVTDTTTSTFYYNDLGVNIDSLRTKAAVQGDVKYDAISNTVAGPLTIRSSILGAQTNLATFLSTGDHYLWSIMGADATGTGVANGDQRFVATSNLDVFNGFLTNSDATAQTQGLKSFFADVNRATYTNNTSTQTGWGDKLTGKNAPTGFNGNFPNGVVPGASQTLYMLSTFVDPQGNDLGNVYASDGTFSLSSAGVLSYTGSTVGGGGTVPLPASVWLLGTGLLGLAGVGRRKLAA